MRMGWKNVLVIMGVKFSNRREKALPKQRLFSSVMLDVISGLIVIHATLAIDCKSEHAEAEQNHGAGFRDGRGSRE